MEDKIPRVCLDDSLNRLSFKKYFALAPFLQMLLQESVYGLH